jgi:hypothetical protein
VSVAARARESSLVTTRRARGRTRVADRRKLRESKRVCASPTLSAGSANPRLPDAPPAGRRSRRASGLRCIVVGCHCRRQPGRPRGQVLGTGSRISGAAQGPSRKGCCKRRTDRIAGKARNQALFPDYVAEGATSMVRRGSTVRVRQRALQKPRKSRLSPSAELARAPVCGGYGALYGAFSSETASGKRQNWPSSARIVLRRPSAVVRPQAWLSRSCSYVFVRR